MIEMLYHSLIGNDAEAFKMSYDIAWGSNALEIKEYKIFQWNYDRYLLFSRI